MKINEKDGCFSFCFLFLLEKLYAHTVFGGENQLGRDWLLISGSVQWPVRNLLLNSIPDVNPHNNASEHTQHVVLHLGTSALLCLLFLSWNSEGTKHQHMIKKETTGIKPAVLSGALHLSGTSLVEVQRNRPCGIRNCLDWLRLSRNACAKSVNLHRFVPNHCHGWNKNSSA